MAKKTLSSPRQHPRALIFSLAHQEASVPHLSHTTPTTRTIAVDDYERHKHQKSLRPIVLLVHLQLTQAVKVAMPLSLASNAAPSAFSSGSAVSSVSSGGAVPSTTPRYEGAGEGSVVRSAETVAMASDTTRALATPTSTHTSAPETTAAKSQSMGTPAQSTTPTDMSEGVKGRQSVGISPTSVEEVTTSPRSLGTGKGRMGLHTARLLAATMASKASTGTLGMQASTGRTSPSESTSPTTHPFHSASRGEGGTDGRGARGSGPCPGPDPTPSSAGARAKSGASAPATIAPQSELAPSLVSQLRGQDRVQDQGQVPDQWDGQKMVQGQGQGPGQPPTGRGQSEQVRLWHCR